MATEVRTTALLPPHDGAAPAPGRRARARTPQKASKNKASENAHSTTQGEAMLAVGHAAYARKDWPAAMKAFQQSAEAGSAEGAWELSLMHAHGKTGVVDKEQAKKWLTTAADGGEVKAQMFLAQMSTFGRGGYAKDEAKALEYLERAADQGNAHATHQVGVRYLYAVSVEQDLDKAIAHFDRAIELGSTDAVKDREIAQKKKRGGVVRDTKKGISKRLLGRSKSKKNTVESSLRIKAASAPLKSPSSSRQTSRQSTPAEEPYAEVLGETEDVEGVMAEGIVEGVAEAEPPALTNKKLRIWVKSWCSGINSEGLPPISTWNTSRVTDMSKLFLCQREFNDDLSAWDTSNVTNMGWMFYGASSFNQPLNDWRVDNVTNMRAMFHSASAFNHPLNAWRVDKVADMNRMFAGAKSFNQPLAGWRVDNVTDMSYVFHNASTFNQPLNDWRVDNLTDMQGMFGYASSFNQSLNGWRVDNVRDMAAMFRDAKSFNQPLNDWRVDNVTNMSCMFLNASSFNQPLGDWRVDNVTMMSCMFMGATSFDQPLDDWRLVVCCLTERMFYGTNFENSRPVRRACCAVSWREHLRIAWSFAKIIFVDGR